MSTRYWLQTKAPAGNWVDCLGSELITDCISHGHYRRGRGDEVRVIERKDRPIRPINWGQQVLSCSPL
jgi:hypothetical protein